MKPRKVGRSTNNLPQSQAAKDMNDDNFTTNNKYKKILHERHFCPCWLCNLVGNYFIKLQYTNFNNILIEDNSKLIFNP